MKPGDKYLKIVEWSEEDQCYVGTCPGLMRGGVHGDNEADVYKELCLTVDEWIELYQEDGDPLPPETTGKEYSGKFVVRVGKELHKTLAIESLRRGESLNTYCVNLIREERGEYKTKRD
jgi:predicted HicB family RNase H-like nuclease